MEFKIEHVKLIEFILFCVFAGKWPKESLHLF